MTKIRVMTTIVIDMILCTIVLGLIALCIPGCGSGLQMGLDPFTPNDSCTVYSDLGIDVQTSLAAIPKVVKNPCAAQNIIATTVKAGVVLNAYQAKEFVKWAQATRDFIVVGMPFEDVKKCVGEKIPELNDRIGLDYVTMSSVLGAIPSASLVTEDDLKIITASLEDLIKQVDTMKKRKSVAVESRRYLDTMRFRS